MTIRLWLMLTLFISLPSLAASPSFDCNKASGEVEILICNDEGLAKLDRQLASVYHQALANIPAAEQPKAMQRGWIKGRNDCWKSADVRQCIAQNYQSRIIELQIEGGLLEVPASVVFNCGEFSQITAVFYTQLEPVTAVFSFDDHQLIASNVISASGAKYQGQNFEFWEHHGEASVRYFDTAAKCKIRK